ncbi:ribosomal protein S18 acetylase RimI-like enzyme [Erwinia toletana]|uniref:Ribosomal protein S18 acetylase RimI-like enzyme n=1 Tax=Winslowiella toletana TaxID=92490 RepID=A0ABS4PEI3_9GAMM|nr:GNAT family N-acetyltransferase [Winslowiella toletana]MBP2171032.1 ribosomal protein S18 acetylase RimI-like enzyme [Winslowiella toletana]
MKINITDTPNAQDEEFVIDSLWAHNDTIEKVDIRPLFLTFTDDQHKIIAGLVARTWWGGLEVQYLWVSEAHRKNGLGLQLMQQAEQEAINRGCHMAYVDTFSFQAKGFYEKLGYQAYGKLGEYAHKHVRYYLAKNL